MSDAARRFLNSPAGTDAWFAAWRELETRQVQQKRLQQQVIPEGKDEGREPSGQERESHHMDLPEGPHPADGRGRPHMGMGTDMGSSLREWDGPDV